MPLTKIEGPSLGNVTISSITSNASFDSGTLFVDAANNVVGIGNTTPIHKLRVEGTTSVSGNVSIDANLVVTGNLTVSGTTVTVNSENVLIKDNLITLSSNVTGAPVLDAGIEVNRGTSANVILKWNETSDLWQLTNDGTNYGNILTTLSSTGVNASALSTGTVPLAQLTSANSSANGVVDTTTQTFAGLKTFNSNATFSGSRTFFASGSVLDWNSGDVTLTHSANTLTFAGASSGYIFSDGNVGIGTTSPNKAGFTKAVTIESDGQTGFEIVGSKTTDAALGNIVWINAAGSYAYMGQVSVRRDGANNSGALTFSTWNAGTGAERMRIDSSGNVGIGVTPSYDLHLQKASAAAGSVITALRNTTATGATRLYLGNDSGDSAGYFQIFGTTHALRPSVIALGGNAAYPLCFDTNGIERMRITSGGNVGIGTTSPSYQLSVLGRIVSSGSSGVSDGYQYGIAADTTLSGTIESNILYAGGTIAANTTVTTRAGLRVDNVAKLSGASVGTNYGVYIANQTAGTTNWAIYSAGGDVAIAAAAKFYLDSGGDTYITEYSANTLRGYVGGTFAWQSGSTIWYFQTEISVPSGQEIFLDGGPAAGAGDSYLSEAGANVIRVTVGGVSAVQWDTTGMYLNTAPPTSASAANAVVGSGSDYLRRSTSSLLYKHDIATLDTTDALSAVMAMRPVTYRGKTDEDQRRFVGFIAEEMQEIAPLLCTYDEGGESGTPNYVTYDRVTAYLVAVVQQQQNEINALKARLATLEG